MEWISVKDRLPDLFKDVLLCGPREMMMPACCSPDSEKGEYYVAVGHRNPWNFLLKETGGLCVPRYWMDFPDPPEIQEG